MRLQDLVAQGTARLRAAGIDDAAGDARRLLAHAAGLPAERLILHLPDEAEAGVASRFDAALAARGARQPVAQIVGERHFWGRVFRVTRDTLDPRPETEVLVAEALAEPFTRVLDLGTGTGCILLSCLADKPGATGVGTDLSAAALAVARENAASLGLAARAEFRVSDWFAAVPGRFDLIVSNPPYIAEAEIAGLAPEVRDWEPRAALTPGGDGLDAYRRIAAGAALHLAPGGRLLVEVGAGQADAVAALVAAGGLGGIRTVPDLDGRARIVAARRA